MADRAGPRVVESRLLGGPEAAAMLAFLDHLGYDPARVLEARIKPGPIGLDIHVEHIADPDPAVEARRRARRLLQV